MPYLETFLRDVEQERLPALYRQLIPLENGQRTLAERRIGGPWVDVTRERIAQLKGAIADYELIAGKLREGGAPSAPRPLSIAPPRDLRTFSATAPPPRPAPAASPGSPPRRRR